MRKFARVVPLQQLSRRLVQLETASAICVNFLLFFLVQPNNSLGWGTLLAALLVANMTLVSSWRVMKNRAKWFYFVTRKRLQPLGLRWWAEYHLGQIRAGRKILGGHWERWWIDAPVLSFVWLRRQECHEINRRLPPLGRKLFTCETWPVRGKLTRLPTETSTWRVEDLERR